METKSHSFSIEDAQKYGIEKAILLQNLRFWLDKELANSERDSEDSGPKVKEHEGADYVWTYNSARAFANLFPYMAPRSIGRWLGELEADGIIISGVFNKAAYDKTKWYTMPEYSLGQNGKSVSQNGQSTSQNGQSEGQDGQPIPDINTNINTNILGDSEESPVDNSKNERAELWDALVVELGYTVEDMTKNVRGQLNNAVKQLHDIGATPNDIKSRSKAYRALFPSSAFTAMALVNRWPDLRSMKAQPSKLTGGVDYDSPEREWTFDDKGDVIL